MRTLVTILLLLPLMAFSQTYEGVKLVIKKEGGDELKDKGRVVITDDSLTFSGKKENFRMGYEKHEECTRMLIEGMATDEDTAEDEGAFVITTLPKYGKAIFRFYHKDSKLKNWNSMGAIMDNKFN